MHAKRLYAAIGQTDSRNRKPAPRGRSVERLMLLDAVLDDRDHLWLGTEADKWRYVVLPIGVVRAGDDHVFVYLARRCSPIDLRAFLAAVRETVLWDAKSPILADQLERGWAASSSCSYRDSTCTSHPGLACPEALPRQSRQSKRTLTGPLQAP